MIPIITPELTVVFSNTPCCDPIHHGDSTHLGCRATKKVILLDNADFALVHSSMLIEPDYTFRGPSKGSREILLRMRMHGDPCMPSYLPEQARSCQRLQNARVDKCRTHWKNGREVQAPEPGKHENEEDEYVVMPETCQFDEDEFGNLSVASDTPETVEEPRPEKLQVARREQSFSKPESRMFNEERWTMVEKEDAEEDNADWEFIDREQVQEAYWEDYFVFNGCITGAGKSATM